MCHGLRRLARRHILSCASFLEHENWGAAKGWGGTVSLIKLLSSSCPSCSESRNHENQFLVNINRGARARSARARRGRGRAARPGRGRRRPGAAGPCGPRSRRRCGPARPSRRPTRAGPAAASTAPRPRAASETRMPPPTRSQSGALPLGVNLALGCWDMEGPSSLCA